MRSFSDNGEARFTVALRRAEWRPEWLPRTPRPWPPTRSRRSTMPCIRRNSCSSGTSSCSSSGVLWLSLAYWVYKDARRRIDDPWLVGGAVVLGLFPPFVGPLVYLLFRPGEYLADARFRELELEELELALRHSERCPLCRVRRRAGLPRLPGLQRQAEAGLHGLRRAGRGRVADVPVVRSAAGRAGDRRARRDGGESGRARRAAALAGEGRRRARPASAGAGLVSTSTPESSGLGPGVSRHVSSRPPTQGWGLTRLPRGRRYWLGAATDRAKACQLCANFCTRGRLADTEGRAAEAVGRRGRTAAPARGIDFGGAGREERLDAAAARQARDAGRTGGRRARRPGTHGGVRRCPATVPRRAWTSTSTRASSSSSASASRSRTGGSRRPRRRPASRRRSSAGRSSSRPRC